MSGLKGFSDVNIASNDRRNLLGNLTPFKFSDYDKKKVKFRLLGPLYSYCVHWVPVTTKTGKKINLPKLCVNYDPATDNWEQNGCPWCDSEISGRKRYLVNAIFREEQDREPKKTSRTKKEDKLRTVTDGFDAYVKDPNSDSWTPVVVLDLNASIAKQLKDLTMDNLDKKDRVRELSDKKYGMDITIKYDSSEKGTGMFRVDTVKRTPLTEEEETYLIWDIWNELEVPSLKEATKEFEDLSSKGMLNNESEDDEESDEIDDLDDEDEDESPKKSKKSKSKKSYDEDDEDYEDEDDSDDDDDYSDDEEEEEDYEDDEDEEPVKKKSKKDKKKKKKKAYDLDDL